MIFGKKTDDPLAGWLCCPRCLTYVRPVMFLAGEMAIFDCTRPAGCGTRYFVGLGASRDVTTAPLEEKAA